MSDLVDFLRARLDEDERTARCNSDGKGLADGFPDYRTYVDEDTEAADLFIRHFNPARELREVEAKRRIIDEVWREIAGIDPGIYWGEAPDLLLRLIALPYADHPDYREEWKP